MSTKPVQFVNVHGKPVDLAQQMQEAFRDAAASRVAGKPAKRKPTVKNGYAAPPGTGPEGETCKTCAHKVRCGNYGGKSFLKCNLRKATWTSGEGTDILARTPACNKWEKAS